MRTIRPQWQFWAAPPNRIADGVVRVSGRSQEFGYSPETQERAIRLIAAYLGFEIGRIYHSVERGTLKLKDREGLRDIRRRIEEGEIGLAIFYDYDRAARDDLWFELIYQACKESDVGLALCHGDPGLLDDTITGRILRAFRGNSARQEVAQLTERTGRGKSARMALGVLWGTSQPLYGYEFVDIPHPTKPGRVLPKAIYRVKEAEARVVRDIFELLIDRRLSLRQIAHELTRRGLPAPKAGQVWQRGDGHVHVVGSHWQPSYVASILKETSYVGEGYASQWKSLEDPKSGRKKLVKTDASAWKLFGTVSVNGEQVRVVPPIVDRELFDTAQAILAGNRASVRRTARNAEQFLLRAGRAFCGTCGRPLYAHSNPRRDRRAGAYPSYVCSKLRHGRDLPRELRPNQPGPKVSAPRADALVWSAATQLLNRPEEVQARLDQRRGSDPFDPDIQALTREMTRIQAEMYQAQASLLEVRHERSRAMLTATMDHLAEQLDRLETERSELEERQQRWQATVDAAGQFVAWLRRFGGVTEDMPYPQRRKLIEALDLRLIVYPAGHKPRVVIVGDPEFNGEPRSLSVLDELPRAVLSTSIDRCP